MKTPFLKNSLRILISNMVLLVAGLATGFIVPMILNEFDYGMFKTFTLYANYITILQFGFVNGIFIIYGGQDYNNLDLKLFRFYTRFLLIAQGLITVSFFGVSFFFDGVYRYLVILLGIYSFAVNMTSYFQRISQTTQRFKEYSIIQYIQSGMKLFIVLLLFLASLLSFGNFEFYTFCYVFIFIVLFSVYIFIYKDLIFGSACSIKTGFKMFKPIFKAGVPLLVADFVVQLVYNCDSQIVNIYFDKISFGQFSFAYTIVSLVTTLISAVSIVLYPKLKRMTIKEIANNFEKNISILSVIGFGCLIGYFFVEKVIHLILPNYIESLSILRIIFPGVVVTGIINVLVQNYFKTLNKNLSYFLLCTAMLAISILLNFGAFFIFHSMESIAIASVFVFFTWLFVSCFYLKKKVHVSFINKFLYIILCALSFYISVYLNNGFVLQIFTYIILFLSLTFLFNFRFLLDFAKKRMSSRGKQFSAFGKNKSTLNKKMILNVSWGFSIFVIAISVASSFVFNTASTSVSNILMSSRTTAINYNFGYLESSNEQDDFYSFLTGGREVVSTDMKKTSNVFLMTNDNSSLALNLDDEKVIFPDRVVANYSSNFAEQYYGFELLFGDTFLDIGTNSYSSAFSFYITETFADNMLGYRPDDPSVYKTLIYENGVDGEYKTYDGKYLKYGAYYETTSSFTILGIISNKSINNKFLTMAGTDSFVFSSFDSIRYLYAGNANLYFCLFGSSVDTQVFMSYLLSWIGVYSPHSFSFIDLNNGRVLFEEVNNRISSTIDFYSNSYIKIIGCVFLLLSIFAAFFILNNIVVKNDFINNTSAIFILVILSILFVFVSAILQIVSYINIGSLSLSLFNYIGVSLSYVIFVFVAIMLIYYAKKNKNVCYIDVKFDEVKLK